MTYVEVFYNIMDDMLLIVFLWWDDMFIVLLGGNNILRMVGQKRGRGINGTNVHAFLCEKVFKIVCILVIVVTKEDDSVDNVPAEEQGFICSDGGRYSTELGVTDEDCREEQGTVGLGLRRPRESGTMDTWRRDEARTMNGWKFNLPPAVSTYMCAEPALAFLRM